LSFKGLYKTKAERDKEKRDRLFTKEPPLNEDEFHIYFVHGERWYYKVKQDITLLNKTHNAEYLGTGTSGFKSDIKKAKSSGPRCVYCEIPLIKEPNLSNSFTRDHIIPRSRGGKITRPCCRACNLEKGSLMLHSYIQLLNSYIGDYKGELFIKLQTKIKNANNLAKEIENRI